MAILGLREAAKAAGVSRQTIYRYAGSGKLSTVIRDDDTQGVDTAELIRVFGPLRDSGTVARESPVTQRDRPDDRLLQALEGELEATRQALRIAQAELEKAGDREARLLGLLEQQTRLLEHRPEQRMAASRAAVKVDTKGEKSDEKAKKKKKRKK
jgi:AcrR family transcriptional regulator